MSLVSLRNGSANETSRHTLAGAIRWLLTTDFCPWANRYFRFWRHPLGCLLGACAASLLCGLFVVPQAFVVCGVVAAVIALGLVWPWVALRGLGCTLAFEDRRGREGKPARVKLTISNRLPWTVWGLCVRRGFWRSQASDDDPAAALARVPGWTRSDYEWNFLPRCRGIYPTQKPRVATAFPFGLWNAARSVNSASALVVWPRTFPLGAVPFAAGHETRGTSLSDTRCGDTGDVLGARPYRQGDSLRRVHWAQTARQDRLIICERQGMTQASMCVVVDVDPAVHVGDDENSSLEWAVRIAASLCEGLHAQGVRVDCQIGQQASLCASDAASLAKVFDALACVGHTASMPPTGRRSRGRDSRQCLEILITTDRGLPRWTESRGSHSASMRRFVVLKSEAFGKPVEGAESRMTKCQSPGRHSHREMVIIDGLDDVPGQFRTQWEELCHAAWIAQQ
jgi:uncharacterized protein (DUF58 family)